MKTELFLHEKRGKAIGIALAAITLMVFIMASAPLVAAQITVDGDASDWVGLPAAGLRTAVDPGGVNDTDLVVARCGGYHLNWSSGYDMGDFAMFYNVTTDTLYFKFNLSGIPGDTDGNYNPDNCSYCSFSGPNNNCSDPFETWQRATADGTGVTTGAYKVMLDVNGDSAEDYRVKYQFNMVLVTDPTEFFQNHTSNFTTAGSIGTGPWSPANISNVVEFSISPAHNMTGFGECGDFNVVLATCGTGNDFIAEDSVDPFPVNQAPDPVITVSDVCYCRNMTFDGSLSDGGDDNITSWEWDFGDSTPHAFGAVVEHHYASVGTYNVTLTVTDEYGFVCSNTTEVEVFENPIANFTATNACYCTNVSFFDATTNGTPPYTYRWDFDNDGNYELQGSYPNPTWHYDAADSYTARLNVTDENGCTDEITKPVQVYALPTSNFTANNVCFCTNVTFTDTSVPGDATITSWFWQFGDGNTATTQDASWHYSAPGTYLVNLTVTDANNCTNTTSKSVTVYVNPVANFTATSPCYCTNTIFTDTSVAGDGTIMSWSWTFGDGDTSTLSNPTHHYAAPGPYNVTLNVTDEFNCTGWITKQVVVYAPPTANFTANNVCFCTNVTFTDTSTPGSAAINAWLWQFGDGNTSTAQNPSWHYSAPGTYLVNLTVTDTNSCSNTTSKSVTVWRNPTANFSFANVCYCTNVTFTGTSVPGDAAITTWSWQLGDGNTATTQNVSWHYAAPGTYKVNLTVTDANGCSGNVSKTVTISASPIVDFSANTPCFCHNVSFTDLSVDPDGVIVNWTWDFGDGVGISYVKNPQYHYNNPGTYPVTLTVMDDSSCSNSTTKNVTVYENPSAGIKYYTKRCDLEVTFEGTVSGGTAPYTFHWDFGEGNTSSQQNPVHTFANFSVYYTVTFTVVDAHGCNDTAQTLIRLSCERPNTTIRVYGEDDIGPECPYEYWRDPFDPTAIEKDSLTFNPAIILWNGTDSPMSANSKNIHEKKFLRLWYEPEHVYSKPTYVYPTIELESTYMLIDRQDWVPTSGPAGTTFFKFPIVEIPGQIGVGGFENEEGKPSRPNVVTLALVEGTIGTAAGPFNKTTSGKIRLEKTYTLNMGETVQFLDHKLQYEYVVTQNGQEYAKVKVSYAGNLEDDSARRVVLGEFDDGTAKDPHKTTWFKRHNERYGSPSHPDVTWYARFEDYFPSDYRVEITIGKELTPCDTYYVNCVRYDVMAVEVIDTDGVMRGSPYYDHTADEFKYITIKTPLPKGTGSVPDDGIASSQWICSIDEDEEIPVNPPFNEDHLMVDDINVVLWEPTVNAAEWPVGDPAGVLGEEFFPWAERYLTMQADEIAKEEWCYEPKQVGTNWMNYFNVKPIDMDKDGIWIAYDVNERILEVPPLHFVYLDESVEPRFTTDLYEILNETLHEGAPPTEGWAYFDINTRPDHYTEFELPALPDVMTPYWNKTGDYLLTSAFLAPNSIGRSDINRTPPGIPRLAFAYDVEHEMDALDEVIMGGPLDIYVNDYGPFVSVRIYGEDDMGPLSNYTADGRFVYSSYEDPFDPAVLQKDSITFNPAIVLWDGSVYPMSANSTDIDVKKYLRMWYEPDHVYSKPVYKRPTIEVETTYMMIDSQDKLPFSGSALQTFFVFPIAENETTEQPGLELFENPGSDPDRENVVTLAYVNGSVDPYTKTVDETATIRLEKTYTLDVGEKVQFLDHNLEFVGVVINNDTYYAKVRVEYAGNPTPDTGATVVLGQFDSIYKNPHQITWFKRHSETFEESSHPQTTWYAYLTDYFPEYNRAEIAVGKELQPLDVFYVDGVRYDAEAIEVIDTTNDSYADQFKYITIRTPMPKAPTKVLVDDDGIISSQKIWTLPPEYPIPLNPPFNMVHDIVDDIAHTSYFPSDVEDRIIGPYAPLEVYYVAEAIEPRYSTNLLEILNETLYQDRPPVEDWIKYDVITRPDQYTEFVLPADWAHHDSTYRNDYLITTSFLANNSINLSELVDSRFNIPRMAFVFDAMDNTGIYINKPLGAPPVVFNEAPVVNLTVSPGTSVEALETVEICTDGTLDDQWPLDIEIDWQDGTVESATMVDQFNPVCFEHKYFESGTYAVAVTATDKYDLTDTKTVDITVTNDGAILLIKPGWNAFSTPVASPATVNALFGYSWFYAVYAWNESTQSWDTVPLSSTLDPTRGYFVHGPMTGTVEIELTGTKATYDASWFKTGWNLVGTGFDPVALSIDKWAYWYDGGTLAYVPTHNLDPEKGYFMRKV